MGRSLDLVVFPRRPRLLAASVDRIRSYNSVMDSAVASNQVGDGNQRGETDGAPLRTIAHIDLDAFFVSVELQRRPDLKGLPVIVSGSGPRSVVTTASYEARRHGVGSAMPAAKALRLCPDAVVIEPDSHRYREASRAVMAVIHHQIDEVEQAGLDEAYIDLTGLSSPIATMRTIVREIEEQTGLHASVGIGPNKLVAKVASDAEKPRGFVVISREQACEWFADRPCGLIPGIGPKTVERLRVLRIESIAQLAGADEQQLWEAFGERQGSILKSRAAFIDGSPVVSNREAVSESRETTFDTDLSDRTELLERLAGLSADLCSALRRHGHRGRTIGIKIRYANFETHTRARTLSALTSDQETVTRVARELFEEFDPQHPVRLIGVRVAGFQTPEAASGQMSLPLS